MLVNALGHPVTEETLFMPWSGAATLDETKVAIGLLCQHLNLTIVRTNAKGATELVIRLDSE
jgi:hypothetical protein